MMPNNKMERFTQRARRVLSLAQEEAERLRHNYIGTEHLLLGLMREEGGIAGRVLRDLEIKPEHLELLVEELTRASTRSTDLPLDLSPGTKRVLEEAVDEARRMGHHYIGTEHLLLGLVRRTDGVAIDILKRLGISPEIIRRQTRAVLQEPPNPSAKPASIKQSSLVLDNQSLQPSPVAMENSAFHILQAAITRILDMVETERLTTTQAAELVMGLHPYMRLTTGEKVQLAQLFNQVESRDNRYMRVQVSDKSSHSIQFDMKIPLQMLLNSLDTLVSAVAAGQLGLIWTDESDAQNRMEIRIEEDKS